MTVVDGLIEQLENRQLLTVFTVTNTSDAGAGSLRWALDQSNNTPGLDTIRFNLAGSDKTIRPTSPLPLVYDAAVIDATTQPGYAGKPLVRVDGASAGAGSVDGFKLFGGCTIKGLDITGFSGQGVTTIPHNAGGNVIQANWIGVDLRGNAAPNGLHDVGIYSSGNVVGGPNRADGNVLSASTGGFGVFILGGLFGGPNGDNTIENNLIGVDPTGSRALGNINGVGIQKSPRNAILNNVISGSRDDGILLIGAESTGAVIRGNYIGTDRAGSAALPNGLYGIEDQSPDGVIGGTKASQRNVISGNGNAGIVFWLSDAHGNLVQGNYIGTDATGTRALGNGQQGVCFSQAGANTIGGPATGAGNVISANKAEGVGIFPGAGEVVQGNRIGVGADGRALGNGSYGVDVINGSTGCLIGGAAPGDGNVIADNAKPGVWVTDAGNTVVGNATDAPTARHHHRHRTVSVSYHHHVSKQRYHVAMKLARRAA